jgi:hypothetical protein
VPLGAVAQPATLCIAGTVCTPLQQEQYDIWVWKCRLNAANNANVNACNPTGSQVVGALPSGDGQVVVNFPVGAGQVTATITIQWDDSIASWAFGTPAAAAPNPMTFTLESAL